MNDEIIKTEAMTPNDEKPEKRTARLREKIRRTKDAAHRHRTLLTVIGLILLPFLLIRIPPGTFYLTGKYYYRQGEYEKASRCFDWIVYRDIHYLSSTDYYYLCKGLLEYKSAGDMPMASYYLEQADFFFPFTNVRKTRDYYLELAKEGRDKAWEQRKREQEEYRQKVKNGVPFVGMDEKDITHTTLGDNCVCAHDFTTDYRYAPYKNKIPLNTYTFYREGSHRTVVIFEAVCKDGTVTQVSDLRNNPKVIGEPPSWDKKRSDPDDYDEFDVNDYAYPDDFYYDHYDDFYDYEDAEDYFYTHHK